MSKISQVRDLVQARNTVLSRAGRQKPAHARISSIQKQPRRNAEDMGRPGIDDASVTEDRDTLSRVGIDQILQTGRYRHDEGFEIGL